MDIRPNHTIYINNINDKIKKEGIGGCDAPLEGRLGHTGPASIPGRALVAAPAAGVLAVPWVRGLPELWSAGGRAPSSRQTAPCNGAAAKVGERSTPFKSFCKAGPVFLRKLLIAFLP